MDTSRGYTEMPLTVFVDSPTDENLKKVNDILRESITPYESFVHTFGKERVRYDERTNAFYFTGLDK